MAVLLVLSAPPGVAHSPTLKSKWVATRNRAQPANAVPVGLEVGSTSVVSNTGFLGTTVSAEARMLGDEAAVLNSTHSHMLVWPGANAGDYVNMLNDTLLKVNGTSLTWKQPETNETQFIRLCRDIGCEAIMQVPGQIDNATIAAAVVNYTEKTLGFTPAYWEVGNEPELWQHWREPWNEWNLPPQTGSELITPNEYAWELHNYTAILRTADPNIRILGLAGTGRPNGPYPLSTWINATIAVDGPELAGIAFHVYTAGSTGELTVPQFYGVDAGTYGVAARVANARSAISNQMNVTCPTCGDPPLVLTELGSALSHYAYDNLSRGFAGGLSMTSSEIQGLDLGLVSLDVFATDFNTSNSWFDLNGTARPDFTDYAQFLSQVGSEVFPVSFQVPSGPEYTGTNTSLAANLYGVASEDPEDGGRSDLLLVNQNISSNVSLSPVLPGVPEGTPVELLEWSGQAHYSTANATPWVQPLTPTPVSAFLPQGLPSSWTLPPQTLALFEAFPSPGTQVTFRASGIPNGTRWFLSVDGSVAESTTTDLSLLLPQGNSTLGGIPLVLPLGTFSPNPVKRMNAFPPPSLTVGLTPFNVTVPFVDQWNMTWTIDPSGTALIPSSFGWVNASAPTNVTAIPVGNWLITGWAGSGPGNYTGPGPIAVVHGDGAIHEVVDLALGYNITFQEAGLGTGTTWTIQVGALRYSSTSTQISFPMINGSYAWSVLSVPGYTESPSSGNLSLQGGAVSITLSFTANPTGLTAWWDHNELRVVAALGVLSAVVIFVLIVNARDRRRHAQSKPPPPPPPPYPMPAQGRPPGPPPVRTPPGQPWPPPAGGL